MTYVEEELLDIEIQNYLTEKVSQITCEMLENFKELDYVEVKLGVVYEGDK